MRIRRKKWARPELDSCGFYVKNPIDNIGKWSKCFEREQPLHLELGCGKGVFTAEIAANTPQINYVAIDINSDVLGVAKRNIEKEYHNLSKPIDNILLTIHNIERIPLIFNYEDKVDRIYINFCNPWPKPKHKKRRLTYPKQLENYKKFLIKNGEIYFKTDDDGLFKDSIKYFEDSGFIIDRLTYDLLNEEYSDLESNIKTEHENKFIEQGVNIKFLTARKI